MHVLIVEDTENDAELIQHTLRNAGYEVVCEVVDTPAAMRAALESLNWDVITSDHSMPQFSAPAALALAKEIRPDVPFIIVSGEMNLNLAVSLMRDGARDYIQKRELPLLIPTIEREFREAKLLRERQMADAALIESEERFRLLFQSMDSGFALHEIICDAQGVPCDYRFLEINPAFEKLTGLKADALIGHTNMEMLPGTEKTWIERYGKVALTGEAAHFENYSGELGKYYEVIAYSPTPGQFAVIFRDITERKQAEEALRESEARTLRSESRLKMAQSVAHVGDWIWNIKDKQVEWSDEMYRIFAIEKNSYTGRLGDAIAQVIHPDDLHIVQPANASAFIEKKPVEYRIIWPDGSIRYIVAETGEAILDGAGTPIYLTGTCQDITERKRSEEELNKRINEISLLYQASQNIGRNLDLESLLHTFYQQITGIMDCDVFFVSSYDEQQQLIRCMYGYSEKTRLDVSGFPAIPLEPEGKGMQSQVIRSGRSWMLNDCRTEIKKSQTRYYINPKGEVEKFEDVSEDEDITRSAIILPLLFKEKVLGVVQILSYRLNAYSQENLNIAEALVAQFTIAYNNATLYRDAQQMIAERQRAENALRESEIKLRKAQHYAHVGSWTWNIKTNQLDWSDEMFRLFGLERETFTGSLESVVANAIHPDDRTKVDQSNLRVSQDKQPAPLEYRVVWPDQSVHVVWAEAGEFIVDEAGNPTQLSGIVQDITERKRAEQALSESEVRYRSLIEGMPGIVYSFSRQSGGMYYSAQVKNLLGYSPEQLYAQPLLWNTSIHPEDRPRIDQAIREVADKPFHIEYRIRDALGNWHWFVDRSISYQKKDTDFIIEGLALDITERKQAEEQIRQLNAELEQRIADRTAQLTAANQELEAFSYSVSHDLRAPLRSMEGFSAILLEDYAGQLNEQGKNYLTRIQESSRRMGQLINDLLELSRVTRTDFSRQRVDLSELANSIAAELKAQSPNRRVEFEITANMIVQGDENLLKIVIINLLNNAYKFTSQREQALIQVGLVEQDLRWVYFVRDNGAGFNMDYASRLFGAFQRLHSEREFPGTGIGLATVQRIIHRHGGRVWAEGAVDQGATFYFQIP